MPLAIVAGAIANKPLNGGESWVRLSWLRGLQRLGLDVHLVEQIERSHCVGADGRPAPFETSVNRAYFEHVVDAFGLAGRATLVCTDGAAPDSRRELRELADNADVLINISGHLAIPDIKRRIRHRVYVDIDPGFTQLWQHNGTGGARLEDHDCYYTIGENIGTARCTLPTSGIPWRAIRQPVVLDDWPVTPTADHTRFTTIASWRGGFGPVEHNGRRYGLKLHEFRKHITLPQRGAGGFEIALDIHPADETDRHALAQHGWRLEDPRRVAADPLLFRDYVQRSAAEFSVAQGVYVETCCGWISDRTVRYLASGKPAVVQDTGFRATVPADAGLLAFRTLDESAAHVADVVDNYDEHAGAARAIAAEYFDSDRVLGRLLEETGVAA